MGQKRRFECASATSAIAPIAMNRCVAAVHGETGEAEEVDDPTRIGRPCHSSLKSSGTSPNFFNTTASENTLEEELEAMLEQSNKETQLPNRRRGLQETEKVSLP